MTIHKIKSNEEIIWISKRLKDEGKRIVTTNGSFDILHSAHLHILEKARKQGDVLIVLLNSDNSIKKLKGESRPIIPERERAEMLAGLECVDYVSVFDDDNPLNLLRDLRPDVHVKGGSFNENRIAEEKKLLSEWNGEFKNFELENEKSTTNIIDKIKEI
ncbi:D-glycero-beta-D-manno-heptose 1-phosphate adenylyltransferase [Candidatus Pacearchaeota archaeon CG10_big_fil_rev_8_21_14_0_10_34_76]|nr:MAG: D-glycero-beta-D-manno-heptose 1-phosphate adenylyltransferase [Candidatus Pacearchaeota archaeon CG10_big_fil_rev_8_21_14_0_10_34_76]